MIGIALQSIALLSSDGAGILSRSSCDVGCDNAEPKSSGRVEEEKTLHNV